MRNICARQGDILIIKDDRIAEGKPQDILVVEVGEVTGHQHLLVCEVGSKVRGDKTHFTLTGRAKLVHEEHGEIPFEAGNYIVLRKTEFDPIEEELRVVSD